MKGKRAFLDRSGTGEIIKATDMFVLQHLVIFASRRQDAARQSRDWSKLPRLSLPSPFTIFVLITMK